MPIPDYAEQVLRRHAAAIARAMAQDGDGGDLHIEMLKCGQTSTVLKVDHGARSAIAKVFGPDRMAWDAYVRERGALDWLPADMVPGLLLVAEAQRLLLMSFIDGDSLDVVLNGDTLIRHAEFLGQWFGRLSDISPTRPAAGNWHDYVMNYDKGFDRQALGEYAPILRASAVGTLTLAHNDNAMDNFILGRDRRLYGVDFSQCRMKPLGWDLITAAQALFRRFPGDLPLIAGSLVRGYALGSRKDLPGPDFAEVVTLLVLAGPAPADQGAG